MADMRRIHGENPPNGALEKRLANGFICSMTICPAGYRT
jgi:hypothetical protein